MKFSFRIALAFSFGFVANLGAAPDAVFINGNIYTGNTKQPHAESIAVQDGRITFVGSSAAAKKLADTARVIDLHGQAVFPGFTDSHCHVFGIGEREMTLNLEGTKTKADFLAKVKERVAKAKPGQWITGRGWIETFWKPPQFPTAADLDQIAPENPVFLTRADGHAAVANSAALRLAGVTAETPNPFGGEILKDKNGAPTGMLLDNAKSLVGEHIPSPTPTDREEALRLAVDRELSLGWCEIQNAGGDLDDAALIRQFFDQGKSKLRIYNAVYGPGPAADRLLRDGATVGADQAHFTQRTIKVVADGALGSRGAALLEPYSDADTSGFLTVKENELRPMLEEALRAGIQVETHAIGDRTNRFILDQYEAAFAAVPPNERKIAEPRWRIEHAQILSAADLPRFAKLGVIPSMQPSHAISDLFFAP
ncbi:MAG: amidohydrolase, partial [Chthoniobacterales bacterium]